MARSVPGVLERREAGGGTERILLQEITTIGRSSSCTIVVPGPTISRLHASIELRHDRYVISDAGSANGTFVNDQRIEGPRPLVTGDVITLGSDEVSFTFADPEETLVASPGLRPPALHLVYNARIVTVYGVVARLSTIENNLLLHFTTHPRAPAS